MTLYIISLVYTKGKNKSITFVDYFENEYYAARYTADFNNDIVRENKENVMAVCNKTQINDAFVDKLKGYSFPIEYTIYAEVVYDYKKGKIISNNNGIKYVATRPCLYLPVSDDVIKVYIPFESNMESVLHQRLVQFGRKYDEYRTNKDKANQKVIGNRIFHKTS